MAVAAAGPPRAGRTRRRLRRGREAAGLRSLVLAGSSRQRVVSSEPEDGDETVASTCARRRGHSGPPRRKRQGRNVIFADGRALIRSRLGAHAVEHDGMVYLGAATDRWGTASAYWVFGAVADLLRRTLTRPLIVLPPLGCIRLDDVPGTGLQQVTGRAHPDGTMASRIRSITIATARQGRSSSSPSPPRRSSTARRFRSTRSGPSPSPRCATASARECWSRPATARCTWRSRRSPTGRSSLASSDASTKKLRAPASRARRLDARCDRRAAELRRARVGLQPGNALPPPPRSASRPGARRRQGRSFTGGSCSRPLATASPG